MGLAVLRAGLASDAELIQAGWRTGSTAADVGLCARVMARLGQPKSLATEQKVLGVLQGAVAACLGAYPSSQQQDEAELQKQQQQQEEVGVVAGDVQQQIRVAMLKGLISEKSALAGSAEVLQAWQQGLSGLAAAAGGPVKPEQIAAVYDHADDDA
jgi:hypothetical protein